MIVISNSSPLIALSSIDALFILKSLFDVVYIPEAVFIETVENTPKPEQAKRILRAISEKYLIVKAPKKKHLFKRKIDMGERDVLNLALELNPNFVLLDDKKARKEAIDLGIKNTLLYTSTVLKLAEKEGFIKSYDEAMKNLSIQNNFIPEDESL